MQKLDYENELTFAFVSLELKVMSMRSLEVLKSWF